MNKRNKPRLGKGLSALIGEPVSVEPMPTKSHTNTEHTFDIPASDTPDRGQQPAAESSSSEESGRALRLIELDRIAPSPYQPRNEIQPDELSGLADSIRQSGVMQPIIVRRPAVDPAGKGGGATGWELIAGERRWRAAKLSGLDRIPAVVVSINNQTAAEWALIENIQRQDLNAMERARALKNLRETFGLTQAEIAEQVGLERSSVANLLRLTELPTEVQDLIEEGRLTPGHGKVLAGGSGNSWTSENIVRLANQCADQEWSVRRLESEASRIGASSDGKQGDSGPATPSPKASDRDELARQLGEYLGTRVSIRTDASGKKGAVTISFFDVSHFDDVMSRIGFRMRS